jgi:integrase
MGVSDRCLMTWEPSRARWRKMHRGKVYVVFCTTLGVPATKQQSYVAANEWWETKRAELDANHPTRHPHIQAEMERRRDWARQNDPDLAEEMNTRLDRLGKADEEEAVELALTPDLDDRIKDLRDLGWVIPPDTSRIFLDGLLGDGRVFKARHARPSPNIPKDRTVGAQVVRYLELQRAGVRSGHPSVSEYDLIARFVGEFEKWLKPESPIDSIDADRWEEWYHHVRSLAGSIETKKKRYRYARSWVEWMAGKALIPPPANLANRKFRFVGGQRKVPTMTPEEVKSLVEAAPGQLALHLLLMSNCGYTQNDVAELRPDQVDWGKGRICRKRSKTEHHAEVPEVNYKLWTVTFDLLKKHGNRQGDRVLLTKSGLPWVRDLLDETGKRKKVDAIKSNYAHLRKKGFIRPMKLLRKTSATMIETIREYAPYSSHFLGHSPRIIKDRSYTAPNEALFDEILDWLGRQYGFDVYEQALDSNS